VKHLATLRVVKRTLEMFRHAKNVLPIQPTTVFTTYAHGSHVEPSSSASHLVSSSAKRRRALPSPVPRGSPSVDAFNLTRRVGAGCDGAECFAITARSGEPETALAN
jgi:hypothetical protein